MRLIRIMLLIYALNEKIDNRVAGYGK